MSAGFGVHFASISRHFLDGLHDGHRVLLSRRVQTDAAEQLFASTQLAVRKFQALQQDKRFSDPTFAQFERVLESGQGMDVIRRQLDFQINAAGSAEGLEQAAAVDHVL